MPLVSLRTIVTPVAVPTKSLFGVKVTLPVASTVYVPSFGTVLLVVPSSNLAGTVLSIGTSL